MSEPVGVCPKNTAGHEWASWKVDPRKSCVHCGRPGRDNVEAGETGGYFAEATMARAEVFSRLKVPMVSGSGDPKKAWSGGMPKEMAARAAEIVEDKRRRDREAK